MCKLVHFQTYHPLLLPLLVNHVPSLHVCFDFIPELLSHASVKQQSFAIQLAAELMRTYPIAKGLDCTKFAFSRTHQWIKHLQSPVAPTTLVPSLATPEQGMQERATHAQALTAVLPYLLMMVHSLPWPCHPSTCLRVWR